METAEQTQTKGGGTVSEKLMTFYSVFFTDGIREHWKHNGETISLFPRIDTKNEYRPAKVLGSSFEAITDILIRRAEALKKGEDSWPGGGRLKIIYRDSCVKRREEVSHGHLQA